MVLSLENKLAAYKTPFYAAKLIQSSKVVFLVGVTAAGKDTVLRRLIENPDYHHIVSHTTRAPRENHGIPEQDGLDYHFIDLATSEAMIDNGGYVEAKMVHGNVYGTSVAEIQMAHDENKIAITDIEVQGVSEYKAVAPSVIAIFLLPPDFETWQKRLIGRHDGNIDASEMRKRLETAKQELEEVLSKDYFEFIVNQDLEETVAIADQVAHCNFSNEKNLIAKQTAEAILSDLDTYLGY